MANSMPCAAQDEKESSECDEQDHGSETPLTSDYEKSSPIANFAFLAMMCLLVFALGIPSG